MLPIQSNTNQYGAVPYSSNGIIWQGPDIPCINLCNGDTISDVIAKLAEELCDLVDQFDIDTFDLTCFNPICPTPENTHDLIQFLVQQVCALNDIDPTPTPGETGCPDCVVTIAPCFYFLNPVGDQVTTMQLQDYVTAIGNKICTLVTDIATLQATVTNLSTRVNILEQTVVNLPVPTEPLLPADCLIASPPVGGTPLSVVVLALESAFCELRSSTGLPNDIFDSIAKQCGGLNTAPSLAQPSISMGSIPGWSTSVFNLADSINNMWLTICDIRNAVTNIQTNCCPVGCDGVIVNMTAIYDGSSTITLFLTGSVPSGFADCGPEQITITDSGTGQVITNISAIANLNGSGINIPIGPLDPTSSYNITLNGCFTDGSNTCNQVITYFLVNSAACPVLTVVPTTTTVPWSFNNVIPGTITYTVELWNSAGTTLIDSQTASTGPGLISGTFTGTSDGTTYLIRVGIQQGVNPIVYCPFDSITTPPGDYFLWDGPTDFFVQGDGSYWLIS